MPRSIDATSIVVSSAIRATVNTYADLPNPAEHANELYFVSTASGSGFLSFKKYPAGLYIPNESLTAWITAPLNIHMAEDTTTLINITNWTEFFNFSIDLRVGDRLIYNGVEYKNRTGVQTSNPPNEDPVNWTPENGTQILYYNDTGSLVPAFTVVHLKSAASYNGELLPTFDLADASKWEQTQGTLAITTSDIPNGATGFAAKSGRIKGGDTSAIPEGSQLWLSATTPGEITATKPEFPNYAISLGGNFNQEAAPDGEILVSITRSIYDTFNDGWDGAIRETFDFRVTSDGATITGTLTNQYIPTNDLTVMFSDGFYTLDVTTVPKTLTLLPGTATAPLMNYVFIDKATKTLQVNNTGFPITEHAKIAKIGLFDAGKTQTDGAISNQNINDHIKTEDDNGHILHIAERVRSLNAEWDSGVLATLAGTPTNVYISVTEGKVWQLHKQVIPAQDMQAGDEIHVVNDNITPYRSTSNLNDITSYSDGNTWNNDWSNIVVWGVANKTGEADHLMVNLPSDGYNSEEAAFEDRSNFSDYTIPDIFKGVGFLIGRFTIRPSGGTFTYNAGSGFLDLRGFVPNNTAGGSAGTSSIFTAPQYTTTQRDALTPSNGWIIYNTTLNKFQGYENGAWANLI